MCDAQRSVMQVYKVYIKNARHHRLTKGGSVVLLNSACFSGQDLNVVYLEIALFSIIRIMPATYYAYKMEWGIKCRS